MHIFEGQRKLAFIDFDARHYEILHNTCFGSLHYFTLPAWAMIPDSAFCHDDLKG
jgi:hypothetical protein